MQYSDQTEQQQIDMMTYAAMHRVLRSVGQETEQSKEIRNRIEDIEKNYDTNMLKKLDMSYYEKTAKETVGSDFLSKASIDLPDDGKATAITYASELHALARNKGHDVDDNSIITPHSEQSLIDRAYQQINANKTLLAENGGQFNIAINNTTGDVGLSPVSGSPFEEQWKESLRAKLLDEDKVASPFIRNTDATTIINCNTIAASDEITEAYVKELLKAELEQNNRRDDLVFLGIDDAITEEKQNDRLTTHAVIQQYANDTLAINKMREDVDFTRADDVYVEQMNIIAEQRTEAAPQKQDDTEVSTAATIQPASIDNHDLPNTEESQVSMQDENQPLPYDADFFAGEINENDISAQQAMYGEYIDMGERFDNEPDDLPSPSRSPENNEKSNETQSEESTQELTDTTRNEPEDNGLPVNNINPKENRTIPNDLFEGTTLAGFMARLAVMNEETINNIKSEGQKTALNSISIIEELSLAYEMNINSFNVTDDYKKYFAEDLKRSLASDDLDAISVPKAEDVILNTKQHYYGIQFDDTTKARQKEDIEAFRGHFNLSSSEVITQAQKHLEEVLEKKAHIEKEIGIAPKKDNPNQEEQIKEQQDYLQNSNQQPTQTVAKPASTQGFNLNMPNLFPGESPQEKGEKKSFLDRILSKKRGTNPEEVPDITRPVNASDVNFPIPNKMSTQAPATNQPQISQVTNDNLDQTISKVDTLTKESASLVEKIKQDPLVAPIYKKLESTNDPQVRNELKAQISETIKNAPENSDIKNHQQKIEQNTNEIVTKIEKIKEDKDKDDKLDKDSLKSKGSKLTALSESLKELQSKLNGEDDEGIEKTPNSALIMARLKEQAKRLSEMAERIAEKVSSLFNKSSSSPSP